MLALQQIKKIILPNLKYVYQVSKEISKYINRYKIIVIKSTVPFTTGDKIEKIIKKKNKKRLFDVVSNPEFLRKVKLLETLLIQIELLLVQTVKKQIKY